MLHVVAEGTACLIDNAGCFTPDGDAMTTEKKPSGHGLYAKIGEQGKIFFVGSNFRGTVFGPGILYLAIVDSDWENNRGGYRVNVTAV